MVQCRKQDNATVPIYEVGEFIGTYNVSPGSMIVIHQWWKD
ncbi:hypothetical protein [Acidianus infernus]